MSGDHARRRGDRAGAAPSTSYVQPALWSGAAAGFAVGAATRWIGDGTVGVLARLAHTEPGDDAAAIR
ncbi:hypothetical protein ACFSVJ_07375 [Prauserella oleivorans]